MYIDYAFMFTFTCSQRILLHATLFTWQWQKTMLNQSITACKRLSYRWHPTRYLRKRRSLTTNSAASVCNAIAGILA